MLVVKKLKDLRADAAASGGLGRMVKRVRRERDLNGKETNASPHTRRICRLRTRPQPAFSYSQLTLEIGDY